MIDREHLLSDLKAELPKIEADILQYSEKHAELGQQLKAEYQKAVEAGRTSEHFVAWREAQITQAAAAWVLTCVFVRFLEDNNLLDEPVLSGPVTRDDGSRPLAHAKERITHHFNEHPAHGEREYLLALFRELDQFPVIDSLLDPRHNPLWQIPVSDDGAKRLVDFFQRIDPTTGELVHDFTDSDWDTRFLGDLYQDLSESVRKRYALLQTPEFVEEFILDYTLTPAIEAFGLEGLRLIDPTCGSGHFLLTTFERVFDAWQRREPATNARHLAQRALDVVHGVDINPYAIAICRFRLLIAAMKAAQSIKIKTAPDFHFNIACGDSLLHGPRLEWQGQGSQSDIIDEDPIKHVLEVEDKDQLDDILGQQYHVVVGNPPYITASDKALNKAYRDRYLTCHRKYSLGVPFTERFFELTFPASGNKKAGYMGMITTNSFMKREFGMRLIKDYLPKKDLTHVLDTSGAKIPGHGTPTVILFARNQDPISDKVRVALSIKGEPGEPKDYSKGHVWISLVSMINRAGSENDFLSVVDVDRSSLASHPWSLEGGGASEVMSIIKKTQYIDLDSCSDAIGFGAILGEDDAFGIPSAKIHATKLPEPKRPLIEGGVVRNWGMGSETTVIFPYDEGVNPKISPEASIYLWPFREYLYNRSAFSGKNFRDSGREYYEYHQIPKERNQSKYLITFPFVATHNHFVLDRGGKVFNRTAPVIKLPNGTGEADHLVLLGLLNSSLACFWGRQIFFPKGGFADGKWEERLEWDGTKLKRFPIPKPMIGYTKEGDRLLPGYDAIESSTRQLDQLAQELGALLPERVLAGAEGPGVLDSLDTNRQRAELIRAQMVALQEELDWLCYYAYSITDECLTYDNELPPVNAGERAFEIAMTQALAQGKGSDAWFTRHKLPQIIETPSQWPAGYRNLVQKRMALATDDRSILLLEQPEHKRRWLPLNWQAQEQEAIRNWLLRFLEQVSFDPDQPKLTTCAKLADTFLQHKLAHYLSQRYTGTEFYDPQQLVTELIAVDEVPQMASARLKPAAIKKFRAWQETWDKQRLEDAIDAEFGVVEPLSPEDSENAEKVKAYEAAKKQAEARKAVEVGAIPVPPKYAATDFRKSSYWSLRGKLDVPKERFFSLPGCEKPGDSTPVIGWAGLDHLQRAQAIAGWYMERKEQDGWEPDKLMPMLVALEELIPWLKQWHNELHPEFGERMGEFYEGFLFEEMRQLDLTRDDLLSWQPTVARRGRRRKATT